MTLLGKIFTVLIFLMSVVFMSFAICVFQTHKNWKLMVTNPTATEQYGLGLKFQVEELHRINEELKQERERIERQLTLEKAARRHALAALRTQLEDARALLADAEDSLRRNDATLQTTSTSLRMNQETLANYTREVGQLREDIRATTRDRDLQFDKVVKLTDDVHQAHGLEDTLRVRNQQLAIDIAAQKRRMIQEGISIHDPVDGKAPELDGVVTAVNNTNLVEISLGSDDGLREGHYLEVYRDNRYVGRVIVRKIYSDGSVAEILPKYLKFPIQRDDRVATSRVFTNTSS